MDNLELIDTANFWVRMAGRIGFVVLLVAFYKLYKIFASPLTKAKYKWFIRLFASSVVISFALLVVNFIFDYSWIALASMTFNGTTTFILAIYVFKQANTLENHIGSTEYRDVEKAMDALILRMKYR